ncbi:CRM-domain containing factor CFM3, chloroplastic/mitochondrial isoform X1 [Cryptomeria japonica]|uniref:CRM-domain containing factor CFM3, chloroplastic/mitochondrial isoform X1 n=1 Tax=Cryptomeria japonica TaxID=3369 RepID=UPI0027DA91D7|nr:CRM-domain containing factor CFM3, chloroplastic/mitochondrial isoform X1 [Cryptomeria japonica]
MALVPVGPAGLLESLHSSRSLHSHVFVLPTSLLSRKYKRFQCFCSQDALNSENSEYPKSQKHEQRILHSRLKEKYQRDWSVRPSVKRHKFPWEEKQERIEKERERTQRESPVALVHTGKEGFKRSVPIAPWMSIRNKKDIPGQSGNDDDHDGNPNAVAEQYNTVQKLEGPSEKTAMERIVAKLRKFNYPDEDTKPEPERNLIEELFPVEDEPGAPIPNMNGAYDRDESWSAPIKDSPSKFPWDGKEDNSQEADNDREERRGRVTPSLAELTIPEPELNRLRGQGIRLKERIKLGGAGVTRDIVEKVHEKWRTSEIVKFKCEGSSALNMKRTHEILERRTRGLVIWRSGGSIVLYRGMTYESPSLKVVKRQSENNLGVAVQNEAYMPAAAEGIVKNKPINGKDGRGVIFASGRDMTDHMVKNDLLSTHLGTEMPEENGPKQQPSELDYQSEMDKILDELGPRFTDWTGIEPLPVDADLLPKVIPGYKEPFRLLPFGTRRSLSSMEMTNLRRLARILPRHFAIGRNKQHQGLAAAIVKLWEKSEIAKIAIKRGVLNTSNERMAEEIKSLTGGTLLSRNKEFIVIYRGKDFLSPTVSAALMEKETLARELQDEEEMARSKASSVILNGFEEAEVVHSVAGTLAESLEAKSQWSKDIDSKEREKMIIEAAKARKGDIARRIERKLELTQKKVAKAEKELAKVEAFLLPAKPSSDQETITDEERFMFRKLGLRMGAFLLLGRRGIFDGTVENMHLHWKHRELVKIISKEKSLAEVKYTALMLEAESGGTLVSVDKVSKGYAIIVYRGKNYCRPPAIKPKNLLTKRRALKHSIELQRRESLNRHMLQLEKNMEELKFELSRIDDIDVNQSTAAFTTELDSAYLSDVESEDEDIYDYSYDSYSENIVSSELQRDSLDNQSTAAFSAEFDSANLSEGLEDDRSLAWRVQAVAVAPGQFDSRKPLPLGWRGLRDDELTEVAGIDGCVFVHSSGFIGGNKTMDGALEMARKSLRIQ